jgi:hypothetical protein
MPRYRMDARILGERSDAVLRTAMPAHDSGESGANQLETAPSPGDFDDAQAFCQFHFPGLMFWLHVLPKPSVKLKRLKPTARASSMNLPSRTRSSTNDRFAKTSCMCNVVFFGPEAWNVTVRQVAEKRFVNASA